MVPNQKVNGMPTRGIRARTPWKNLASSFFLPPTSVVTNTSFIKKNLATFRPIVHGHAMMNQMALSGNNRTFFRYFIFFPFALTLRSRQKKEGAIPCRVSGEAVGCPVRSTEEKAPIEQAHPPLRSGSYWSKLPTFHQSQNSAANAKSCVVWRILYHNSRRLWARI